VYGAPSTELRLAAVSVLYGPAFVSEARSFLGHSCGEAMHEERGRAAQIGVRRPLNTAVSRICHDEQRLNQRAARPATMGAERRSSCSRRYRSRRRSRRDICAPSALTRADSRRGYGARSYCPMNAVNADTDVRLRVSCQTACRTRRRVTVAIGVSRAPMSLDSSPGSANR
jgi:hypothetical protein